MKHAISSHRAGKMALLALFLCLPFLLNTNVDSQEQGLKIRLSEGAGQEAPKAAPKADKRPADSLTHGEVARLLRRVPSLRPEREDKTDFSLRDRSLPPPRTGETIESAFPLSERDAVPSITSEPLQITRYTPEGESGIVPFLSVTFSQPMVELAEERDYEAGEVPVRLIPQPPGRWRWIGTTTLLFEPGQRFPMATKYRVEISAGTKSRLGNALSEAKSWEFVTSPPKLVRGLPNGQSVSRDPLLFLEFDQRIDTTVLVSMLRLKSGEREWPVRQAKSEEVEADEAIAELVKKAQPGRWIALRVDRKSEDPGSVLPGDTNFTVEIPAGTPSAEGPLTTIEGQLFSFKTYGPLALVEFKCGWNPQAGNCEPGNQWQLIFNNPILKDFDTNLIRIEPALPEVEITRMYDGFIFIRPQSRPRTRYTITISGRTRDIHGQELGQDVSVPVETSGLAPGLIVPGNEGMIVLDPAGQKRIPVYSVNHEEIKVRLFLVGPQDYGKFMTAIRVRYNGQRKPEEVPPFPEIGRLVFDRTIKIGARPDEITMTQIDLTPGLKGGLGHVILIVEPTISITTPDGPQLITRWIQSTGIGLDTFSDGDSLVAWANSLKDGKPLEDVSLDLYDETPAGQRLLQEPLHTSADGTGKLTLPEKDGRKVLIARKGDDSAILPERIYLWGDGSTWKKQALDDSLLWHVIDDRAIYRPGEEVRIKGWVRRRNGRPLGDLELARELNPRLKYAVSDSQGNELATGIAALTLLGGFDFQVKLPATVNLGPARLTITADSGERQIAGLEHVHRFQVQEFRRPEFEVKVTASEGPHFVSGHADLTLEAKYFAGGALPESETSWTINTESTSYTPPNRGDFTFGKWIPWWSSSYESGDSEEFEGRTDADGKHRLRIDFDSVDPPRPMLIRVLGTVEDVNRQKLAGSTMFIVHPADLYVGLRSPRLFVEQGRELVVESIVTDLDGKAIANREIAMLAVRVDWKYEKGKWKERESDPQTCVVKSASNPVTCRFASNLGGRYRITAEIRDDRERRNQSELTLWVSGGGSRSERTLAQEKIELIPDRKNYLSGETAEILVQAPFAPAEGVVTLRRGGIVTTGRFRVESSSYTLRIPIDEAYVPNIQVQVDLVGETWRTDEDGNPLQSQPKRPAFASGEIDLSIPPVKRRLTVTATPRIQELEPGGRTTVAITVKDSDGRPVKASEVTLIVVDEAILSLTDYKLTDPGGTFYAKRDSHVLDFHSRHNVELAQFWELTGQIKALNLENLRGAGGGVGAGVGLACCCAECVSLVADPVAGRGIRSRVDFNPLAAFAAAVMTDATRRAVVQVQLPDNLTRYRVMAIAAAGGNSFGTAESSITARLPLMVRPSAPRFLNYGDRFEFPVVVQNQTGKPLQVDVAVRAANILFFDKDRSTGSSTAGRRVKVPAGDRIEVRFPAGTVLPGIARFQVVGSSGLLSDASEVSLPVWTPVTTEAVAVYGEIDGGPIKQPIQAPKDAIREFGGLDITISSTQLQSLTDAALYLRSYPYECAEQVSSRVLANVALRDTLKAFAAKGLPDPEAVNESVASDIRKLAAMQNDDGGFGFWRSGGTSWPYLSIHVAHALQRAKEKGFNVPQEMLRQSTEYLREIDKRIPGDYPSSLRRSLKSYSFYVRRLMGDDVVSDALHYLRDSGGADKFEIEALGWLLPVFSVDGRAKDQIAGIKRILDARTVETAGTASFTTSYDEGAYLLLHSDRRTDAVLLGGLIEAEPANDLIPKLARGLLAHRKRGRWMNTQENAFALLALDRYFQVYEKETPDFTARTWFGEAYAGEHAFKGRSVDSHRISVPMNLLAGKQTAQDLVLSKEGKGRMYYRIGLQYAPSNLLLDPADAGFTVTRSYEAIDDQSDVSREEDGTWRIRAGARVRVRLTMVASSRRYHVALVDPMPAGFEALNPELAVTEDIPKDTDDREGSLWWRQWYEHQNMRDERVEAFTSLLQEGVYRYTYVARATTPGIFLVAPAKAEEMYAPETFGRSSSTRLIIE